jgi:type IV secretion system protein VirB8
MFTDRFKRAKPEAQNAGSVEGNLRADQLGSWYLQQAMQFERSKVQAANESSDKAWKAVWGMMALSAIVVVVSGILVFNNKPNPPAVLQTNDRGDVTILKTLADAKITYGQATDIAYLRKYVHYRESYDWETIQDYYNATLLMSGPREAGIYATFNSENNKASPVNVLKDGYRVIATGGTISFVGKTALVSFSKKTIPLGDKLAKPVTEYYVATVTYEYVNAPMDDKDRSVNVAGFKVTSYQVARDITKNSAIASGEGVAP